MLPKRNFLFLSAIPLFLPGFLPAQEKSDLQLIIERLDRLERENRNLADEVHALRSQLAGASTPAPPATPAEAPLEERVAIAAQRTEDLSQSKVEAGQRLPVTLTGMVLFNAFLNGHANGGVQAPTVAALANSASGNGASVSQSIIGLRFEGPRVLGDGRVRGTFDMDLWGGSSSSLNHLMRIRVASIRIDWKTRTLMVGQDKPLVAERDPESLSQVAFSPLTAAGNLWLWQPQVRFEQRFAMGDSAGFRAQGSVYQTAEPVASAGPYQNSLSTARPALQGHFQYWRQFGTGARIEIAPGFHASNSQVDQISIPSRLFTIDWLVQPLAKVQFTGTYFHGRNAAGLGGLRQGFTVTGADRFTAVHVSGGWAQLAYLATTRLTFNIYAGQESDRAADLLRGQIARNFAYAANARYRVGSNVLVGIEANQVRTTYVGGTTRLVDHYDLALGYLF